MATSSIPALKTGLVTMLQARPNLSQVQVSYGPPLPNPGREFIWVSSTRGQQTWMSVGGGKFEEYTQQVVFLVLREGADMEAADLRCFALYAELETGLRADPTVGGVVADAFTAGFVLAEGADDSSRESTLTAQVECKQWI